MRARAKFLLVLWIALVAIVAWAATLPDTYYSGLPEKFVDDSYLWEYPVLFAVLCAIIIFAIRPWRPEPGLTGAIVAFIISVAAYVFLAMSMMHAPPVHGYVFILLFLVSQGLLFYCGFAFSLRRTTGKTDENTT